MAVYKSDPIIVSDTVDPLLISLARNCLKKDLKQRLSRVGWDQFSIKTTDSLGEMRARLSLGQQTIQKETIKGHRDIEEEKRRLELHTVADKIEEWVRHVLIGAKFPPAGYARTIDTQDVQQISTWFTPIHAENDSTQLNIFFSVKREYVESDNIDILMDVSLSDKECCFPKNGEKIIWNTSILIVGEDENFVKERFENECIRAYDIADQQVNQFEESKESTVVRIVW